MLYPVYIRQGDDKHAHGVTFPDFPGCFTSADDFDDIPAMIQEAVELYFEGEELDIPAPSALLELNADPKYTGGIWLLANIDVSKLEGKAKRINITMQERLLEVVDRVAKAESESRSGLLAKAVREYISLHQGY